MGIHSQPGNVYLKTYIKDSMFQNLEKRVRTLHRLGSCCMVPGVDYLDFVYMGLSMPPNKSSDVACKACSKKSQTQVNSYESVLRFWPAGVGWRLPASVVVWVFSPLRWSRVWFGSPSVSVLPVRRASHAAVWGLLVCVQARGALSPEHPFSIIILVFF